MAPCLSLGVQYTLQAWQPNPHREPGDPEYYLVLNHPSGLFDPKRFTLQLGYRLYSTSINAEGQALTTQVARGTLETCLDQLRTLRQDLQRQRDASWSFQEIPLGTGFQYDQPDDLYGNTYLVYLLAERSEPGQGEAASRASEESPDG
jgi:hypothetical protein